MSTTEAEPVVENGAARLATAMGEAEKLLARARSRVRRAEDVALIREAFSSLAEAEQRVQEGTIDTTTWRHIGQAVMLADQAGRRHTL
jgi:hypothetical protein